MGMQVFMKLRNFAKYVYIIDILHISTLHYVYILIKIMFAHLRSLDV